MAYPKKYEVTGGEVVNGTPPGSSFTLDGPVMWKHNPQVVWLNEDALIAGGHIRLVSEGKETCPVCVEQGTKKEQSAEYTRLQLEEHHAKAHPGYQLEEG